MQDDERNLYKLTEPSIEIIEREDECRHQGNRPDAHMIPPEILNEKRHEQAKREKTEKNRKVIVTGGELERALGVKSYNKADLLEDIKKLCSVHDLHPEDDNKIVPMSLFNAEGIRAVKENGYWTMEMNCTNAALKYVFIPYGIPYLKYLHFNTPRLSSRYSFFLYQYLESERYKHTEWTVSLEELKKELDCDKQVSYKEFKWYKIQASPQAGSATYRG